MNAMIQAAVDAEGYLVDPTTWDEGVARELAHSENIELNEDTWQVLRFMREYWADHHIAPDVRHVVNHLATNLDLDKKAAKERLFKLFPYGYVQQACKLAGMQSHGHGVPANPITYVVTSGDPAMSYRVQPELRREDFISALRELDSFIDVTLEDLVQINEIAQKHARLRHAGELSVRDIMTTDVVTVSPGASLRNAATTLLEYRISGLPVVDSANKLVGIVTEADFLCAMGIPCVITPHTVWQTLEWMFLHQPRRGNIQDRVSDVMTPRVVTVTGDKTVHDAIGEMKRHNIKRLVVVDARDQVVGVVTRSNLVKVLLQQVF